MQYSLLSSTGSRRLILIFAGWGMDSRVFAHIQRNGYDVAAVWDYRRFDIDWSVFDGYKEICVIAWSMGVYAAEMATHGIRDRVTLRVAVNGTPTPVHDLEGIPQAVYEGTASNLDDRRLDKFFRRMCGGRQQYAHFDQRRPQRPTDELIDELNAIHPAPLLTNVRIEGWDRAYVGREDAIFPAVNQSRAWQRRGVPVTMLEAPHYIDLQKVVDAVIVDKERAAETFGRRRLTYDRNARVQRAIVDNLIGYMQHYNIDSCMAVPGHATLEVGTGTGLLTRYLEKHAPAHSLHSWDIAADAYAPAGANCRCCDAEIEITRTLPERFDVIASASTLQWFNSPRRFLNECARVLRPGGWLVISSFTNGNLEEIAQITGRSLPLPSIEVWRDMIPDQFQIVEFTAHTAELIFENPMDVFRHLRLTGVNGLGEMNAGQLRRAIAAYPMRLDGRYYLTYKPFTLVARKPG